MLLSVKYIHPHATIYVPNVPNYWVVYRTLPTSYEHATTTSVQLHSPRLLRPRYVWVAGHDIDRPRRYWGKLRPPGVAAISGRHLDHVSVTGIIFRCNNRISRGACLFQQSVTSCGHSGNWIISRVWLPRTYLSKRTTIMKYSIALQRRVIIKRTMSSCLAGLQSSMLCSRQETTLYLHSSEHRE